MVVKVADQTPRLIHPPTHPAVDTQDVTPGRMQIGSVEYRLDYLIGDDGELLGYRLTKEDGAIYDVDAISGACDCGDAVWRRHPCKHVRALAELRDSGRIL